MVVGIDKSPLAVNDADTVFDCVLIGVSVALTVTDDEGVT